MFDIGFSEIFIIALVALIVIGPERLPKVARTLGHLFGRMQRYVNDVKADISREMELEELRKLQSSMQDAARSIEQTVNHEINTAQTALADVAANASSATLAPEASSPPAAAGQEATPQLELGLDSSSSPAGRRQA